MSGTAIPAERIERSILVLRKHKVLLDADLAALYGVETRVLVQAVKRNLGRFPDDFMFQLDADEREALRSQSVISNTPGRGGPRYAPYAFTEQGVAMLSSVLNSPRAIAVNDHARLRAAARNDSQQQGIDRARGRTRSQNREKALRSRPKPSPAFWMPSARSCIRPSRQRRIGFVQNDWWKSKGPGSKNNLSL